MRQRDALFAAALVEELPRHADIDDAKCEAVKRTYHRSSRGPGWSKRDALVKAELKLRDPDVLAAVRGVYAEGVGFSIVEAAKIHVQHIRGTAAGADGKANYQALKDYLALTLPKAATKVDSRSVVVNVPVPPPPAGDLPMMSARVVSGSGVPAHPVSREEVEILDE
jgi:hypothetical protein